MSAGRRACRASQSSPREAQTSELPAGRTGKQLVPLRGGRPKPVGYRNSGRDAVLADETAHQVPPPNVGGPQVTLRKRWVPDRRPKVKPAMGSGLVVVRDVGPKDAFKVSSAEDEGPVQALGSEGAHPSFAERVGVRGPDGSEQDSHALGPEHLIEGAGELGVSVMA